HSEESVGVPNPCAPETANPFAGVAQPWLTNIADRSNPTLVSQMALEINHPKNCAAAAQSGVGATVPYHNDDAQTDTTIVTGTMGLALPKLSITDTTTVAPYYCTIGALVAPTNVATRLLS